ncbi:MAG: hypothetical protein AB8G14_08510, partial [Ilumatobacter sp.]
MESSETSNQALIGVEQARPRRLNRSRWAAIGAAVAVTLGSGGISLVRAADDVKSEVTPIAPCRLVDTRSASSIGPISAPLGAAETVIFDVFGTNGECSIPAGVTAIDVNLTAVGASAPQTFITTFPAGTTRPTASQLNPSSSLRVSANSTSITLSSSGQFAIYNNRGTVDVVIDVLSYYTPASGDGTAPIPVPGETGPAGPAGPAGADGADGADGAVGPAGPAGADGLNGAVGPAGADGPAGEAGPAGPAGVDGADGAVGPPGPAGADGLNGAVGPAGADGAVGPAGPAGADGAVGPAGADGAVGPAGPAGADGAVGAAGAAGAGGPAGPAGADGPAGPAGAAGVVGPAGPAGADGAVGPAGPAGADG